MFRFDFQTGLRYKQIRKRAGRLGRALVVCLFCVLALIASFTLIPTYSRYVENLSDSFTLKTTEFYLVPSLASSELTVDMTDGFTPGNDFSVANYVGSKSTTADTAFTIALEEGYATGLFDLYMDDGAEGKILCPDNTISGTMNGGVAKSETYTLYFKLKDSATPEGNYTVNVRLTSSEQYIRSYFFSINIQVPGQVPSGLIEIGDTGIYRPDVEIPDGEIMVFKEGEYVFLTVDDLLRPLVVDDKVEALERGELVGGSLYVPASVGNLLVQSWWPVDTIDWDVEGHIILEPDIVINKNSEVNILSHSGDVILNGTSISGQSTTNNPYKVSIIAESGTIEANGTKILTKADGNGEIILEAKNDINLVAAELTSAGSHGINIKSEEGAIDAANATIKSTNGATDASVIIHSKGQINLDGATVESNGSSVPPTPALLIESTNEGISAQNASIKSDAPGKLLRINGGQGFLDLDRAVISSRGALIIGTAGDISAQSANISNSGYGLNLELSSSNGKINLSTSETAGMPQTSLFSSQGNISIASKDDILIKSSIISASTYGMKIQFQATGLNPTLWAANADLTSPTITAQNLTVSGTPAKGTITVIP